MPGDVYAVGRTLLDDKDWGHSLVMHYDGTAWHQVAAPARAGELLSPARTGGRPPAPLALTGSL